MKKPSRKGQQIADNTVIGTAQMAEYEPSIDYAIEKAIEQAEERLKSLKSLKSNFQDTTVRVVEEAKEALAAALK